LNWEGPDEARFKVDGFGKSAPGMMVGARCACPISGAKSRRWRDAPAIETIVLVTFYETIKIAEDEKAGKSGKRSLPSHPSPRPFPPLPPPALRFRASCPKFNILFPQPGAFPCHPFRFQGPCLNPEAKSHFCGKPRSRDLRRILVRAL